MSTKKRVDLALQKPDIDQVIDKIVNDGTAQPLFNMILFAEWCEKKHNRGFVVYWQPSINQFQVCNFDEWQDLGDKPWSGSAHWHTGLAHKAMAEIEAEIAEEAASC